MTLKINARNDIHLPAGVLRALNISEDKVIKAELRGNCLVLIPVDLEPRYSHAELEALDKIHSDEKKKGWIKLSSPKDIDNLLK